MSLKVIAIVALFKSTYAVSLSCLL